ADDPAQLETAAQVGALRQGLVDFLGRTDAAELALLLRGDFRKIYRLVLKSGIHEAPSSSEMHAQADSLAAELEARDAFDLRCVLALMLLAPGHAVLAGAAVEKMPGWLRADHAELQSRGGQELVAATG